uniref:Ribonuclease H protein At1g65750 family n=1 Tax=Cajanus cajan TaxID=3821 RepID=A0A151QNK7_CAJCA|nr:Putative ribonuclease H protein At1g65750 family [Cajanus cajan]
MWTGLFRKKQPKTKVLRESEVDERSFEPRRNSSSNVCKFWASGNCSLGENCKNLHSWSDGIVVSPNEDNSKPIRTVWWTAPPENFVKINCDGAMTSNGNKAAAGGVARDFKGEFISSFSSGLKNCSSVTEAELEAIKIGMHTIICRGYKNLIVESDCHAAIQLINRGVDQSHPYHPHVSSIHQLAKGIKHIQWNHVFRETNSVADSLAKHGLSLNPDLGVKLFRSPPPFTLAPLSLDESGITYHR